MLSKVPRKNARSSGFSVAFLSGTRRSLLILLVVNPPLAPRSKPQSSHEDFLDFNVSQGVMSFPGLTSNTLNHNSAAMDRVGFGRQKFPLSLSFCQASSAAEKFACHAANSRTHTPCSWRTAAHDPTFERSVYDFSKYAPHVLRRI